MTNTTIAPFNVENVTTLLNFTLGNPSNSTSFPSNEGRASGFSVPQMVLIAILSGSLSVVTVVGNVMVMVSFKADKKLQTISNYFLFSLAMADFILGLVSMPLAAVYIIMGHWPLGANLCDAWLVLDYWVSDASVLHLLIISFDRYFSVTRPLTYRAKRSPVTAACMIISAWGISALMEPPWIYIWQYNDEGKRIVPDDECYIQFRKTNKYITLGTTIASFCVPVTVMCVLYFRIWKKTKKRLKHLPNLQGGKQDNSKRSTSSEEQTAVVELDGRARMGSCLNTISADCDVMDSSFFSKGFNTHKFNRHKPKPKSRSFTWSRMCEWCVAWWHCGNKDYELDDQDQDYWDDTTSEVGVDTSFSGETTLQSSVSCCTSLNVIKEPCTTNPPFRIQDSLSIAQTNRLVSSRSVSSDSVLYTILIRLSASDCEGAGGEDPSIKMIPEHFSKTAPASLTSRRHSEFASSGQPMTSRPSSIADIRMPLDPKVISKQMFTGCKSILPFKLKPLRKKKKSVEKKADKKAAKTLCVILLAFILTWAPFNISVLLKPSTDSDGLSDFLFYLCYINSTLNPICYALCNASFRQTYLRILCCKSKKKHRMIMSRGFSN